MTKMIKRAFAVLFALALLTVSVFADISMDENNIITVSGELGTEYANKMLSLDVYRGTDETGAKLSELSPAEYLSYIVCHTQVMTDSNGGYTFSFKLDGESGYLTAQVAAEGDMTPIRESGFFFVSAEEYSDAVEAFNNADTAEKMLACISEYSLCLGFSPDEYEKLDSKLSCAQILSSMRTLCGEDKEKRTELYNTAVYIQKLNENKIENIFDNAEYSQLDTSDVKDLYTAEFITENFQKDMTERLSGNAYKSLNGYTGDIVKAFVLATVKYPNGYDNIKTVLSQFAAEAGISESLITTANCKKVAGKDLDSFAELEAALKTDKETSSSGGGGGGGGSSSKGNAPGIIVDAEIVETEPVKEMNPELFSDIENVSWAEKAIVSLAEKGIINGKAPGKFFPYDNITREEFVKIIAVAFSLEENGSAAQFEDVDPSAWYAESVKAAVANGIVNGVDGKNFGTGRNITREDIAVIIYRIAAKNGLMEDSGEEELFDDDGSIADYAKEAVYALKKYEIISGNGSGSFMPKAYATRAEAAKIVYGLMSIQ